MPFQNTLTVEFENVGSSDSPGSVQYTVSSKEKDEKRQSEMQIQ